MHCDATRRLDLLRTVRLEFLTSLTSQNTIEQLLQAFDQLETQPTTIVVGEVGCPKNV
jgi:hypothetical protein